MSRDKYCFRVVIVGVKIMESEKIYDLIIIGAGPAGLSAGLYAARAKMDCLILEKMVPGGQIVTTSEVANYPGSIEHETGKSLVDRMFTQCKEFGAEYRKEGVKSVELKEKIKTINTISGSVLKSKAVIIATGAIPGKIGCPGEKELTGKGVSYCATCDADFFSGLEVFAVGGGDTAMDESVFLTKYAKKVTIIHRRDTFRAAKSLVEKAEKNEKIDFILNSEIIEFKGDGILESFTLRNIVTGETKEYFPNEEDGAFGVFVFTGYLPESGIFEGMLEMDKSKYIVTDEKMLTSIPGVFAAGDVRSKTLRQVVTATSDGAIAAIEAEKYIEKIWGEEDVRA